MAFQSTEKSSASSCLEFRGYTLYAVDSFICFPNEMWMIFSSTRYRKVTS